FDPSGTLIRAQQGHSVPVNLVLEPIKPPAELYQGTPERNLKAILCGGLRSMGRHHVHLSADEATASTVGRRRGRPVVLVVDARAMRREGWDFYRSSNGVWLVEHVPPALPLAPPPRGAITLLKASPYGCPLLAEQPLSSGTILHFRRS
ncbi:MAG TPA: RNA 2'-phosphotransferase, partial [Rubrobacter sp.]|nr:RNA 2'-phosphotransferase [Rubrobacter sp.]